MFLQKDRKISNDVSPLGMRHQIFDSPETRAKFSKNFDKQSHSRSFGIEVCLKMLSDFRKYFGTVVLEMLTIATAIIM